MNIEVKKLTNVDNKILKTISTWMYNWWGIKEGYNYMEVETMMKYSLQEDKLPITYGMYLDNKLIGMYQFSYRDLTIRPDLYPWLINVYIDIPYRNMGYGKIMLKIICENIKLNKLSELYLYTEYIGLYEKFGFTFIENINTYNKYLGIQRLYKLSLK